MSLEWKSVPSPRGQGSAVLEPSPPEPELRQNLPGQHCHPAALSTGGTRGPEMVLPTTPSQPSPCKPPSPSKLTSTPWVCLHTGPMGQPSVSERTYTPGHDLHLHSVSATHSHGLAIHASRHHRPLQPSILVSLTLLPMSAMTPPHHTCRPPS